MKKRIASILLLVLLCLGGCKKPGTPQTPVLDGNMRLIGLTVYQVDVPEGLTSEDGKYTERTRTLFTVLPDGGFERCEYTPEGKKTLLTVYDALGRKVGEKCYDEDGETVRSELQYEYDGDSSRITRETEWRGGKELFRTESVYDAYGNKTEETMTSDEDFDGNWELEHLFKLSYTYSDAGQILEQHFVCENEPSMNTDHVYCYNEDGLLIRQSQIRYDREYYVTCYDYDSHGNKISEVHSEDGQIKQMMAWEHSYRSDGRITETKTGDGSGEFRSATRYTYDDYGNCLRSAVYEEGESEPSSYTTHSYQFSNGLPVKYIQETHSYSEYTYCTVFLYEKTADADPYEETLAILRTCGYQICLPER